MSRLTMITGTSGRVGQAVAASATARGERIVGIDLRPGPMTTIVGDLASFDLSTTLEVCDSVIHCAGLHAPHLENHTRSEFFAANVTATERLCEAAHLAGVQRLVFLSTTSVYGRALENCDAAVWVTEDLAPDPRDAYDETKLLAEEAVANANDSNLSTVSLRLARCFPEPHRDAVVNRLYRSVDLRDAVAGIRAAATAHLTDHHVLNLAGPRVFDHSDTRGLKDDPVAVLRRRLPWLHRRFRQRSWKLPSTIDRVYVSDAADRIIGYRPSFGVAAALRSGPQVAEDAALATAC